MFVDLQDVTKTYPGGKPGTTRVVIDHLTWSLDQAESAAITGPSGSGKTTLLNLMGTLDRPDSGGIRVDGEELGSLDSKRLDRFRNRSIGFVFQLHHLLPQCTVLENVLLPTLAQKPHQAGSSDLERARYLLEEVGIWDLRDQKPGRLSGGECQRVAVVRALINKPKLLLADEPTGALNHENAHRLVDLILHIHRIEQVALIMVTHSNELAAKLSRQFELTSGKLLEHPLRS